jgi:hypothetical protein
MQSQAAKFITRRRGLVGQISVEATTQGALLDAPFVQVDMH